MLAALICALIVALFTSVFSFGAFDARAEDKTDDTKEFVATELSLSNKNFSDTSGSYDPTASPTSWTGASVGGGNGGTGVVAGVVDLTSSNYLTDKCGNKALYLDRYPEYAQENNIPQTIFGGNEYGGDKKTLIINTKPAAEVAYAFSSSDMTFSANSFYRISVWVKTGDFAAETGATVKLTGLGVHCGFSNINTVKDITKDASGAAILNKENRYGWVQYKFYVRTSASLSKTVKLSLGIGDAISADEEGEPEVMPGPASGYALFDTVAAHRISAYDFAFETNAFKPAARDGVYVNGNGTAMVLDLYEPEYLKDGDVEIGTFSNVTRVDGYWNPNVSYNDSDEDVKYVKSAAVDIYDSETPVDLDDENVHFTKSPWAPLGKAEYATENVNFKGGSNGKILRISANDGAATRGVASPDVTIERFKFYRMSVWVKDDGVSGGDGISVLIKGENNVPADKYVLHSAHTSLTGDSADDAHYGWKVQVFYIKGSSVSDCKLHFEFWLGSPSNPSEGIALFDNVTFTELAQSDYNEMSAADGGTTVTLDPASTETGVTNGNFISLGSYDEIDFPMPVSDWTFYDASNVATNGFSSNKVDTDKAVHGVIPADRDTFDGIQASGKLKGITNPSSMALPPRNNALLISSSTKTAICYRSPSITAAVDKGYKLTVDMAVDGVSEDAYGASLVLKTTDGNVLNTIEGIKSTGNKFETFTFYIDAPLSERTINVEIWLGLNDRKDNTLKLSDGNVYVKQVAMTEWTVDEGSTVAAEYEKILSDYSAALSSPARLKNLKYSVVSFTAPSFDYFDAYSYNMTDGLGALYGWTVSSANSGVTSGIYDSDNGKGIKLYDGFERKDESGRMLYIFNTANNRTVYTYGNSISLVANTYYRLDVTLKVRVSDEIRKNKTAVGAGINLTGTVSKSFENIKDTTHLVSTGNESSRDYETFKTYTFYISSGASGGNIGLNISFGGDSHNSYIQGKLIVSNISFKSMTQSEYDDVKTDKQSMKVALSEASSDDKDNNTEKAPSEIAWWLIPTLIFSICLVAAIIIIIVMRLRDRAKKKKKSTYTSEYDRASVAKKLDELEKGDAENTEEKDEQYSDRDDGTAAPEQEGAEESDGESEPETETEAEPEAEPEQEQSEKPEKNKKPADTAADDLDD